MAPIPQSTPTIIIVFYRDRCERGKPRDFTTCNCCSQKNVMKE